MKDNTFKTLIKKSNDKKRQKQANEHLDKLFKKAFGY